MSDKIFIEEKDGFNVFFTALEEFGTIDDHFEPKYVKPTLRKLVNGDLVLFCAKVHVEKAGIEVGEDYLGMCIYSTAEEFYTTYKKDYFNDMVETAIKRGKTRIVELIKQLKS